MSRPAKFFEDNLARVSSGSDPIAYNLNAGLLALVKHLDAELSKVHSELDQLKRKLNNIEHYTSRK